MKLDSCRHAIDGRLWKMEVIDRYIIHDIIYLVSVYVLRFYHLDRCL